MTSEPLRVLLVDPSLFTAPYDAALTEGLLSAGVEPKWAVRATRKGDRQEIPEAHVDAFFYRRVDQFDLPRPLRSVAKGLAHGLGLARLVARVLRDKPDIVHFQWLVVPLLDLLAILAIRRRCPVVLTVHDTVPFNGDRLSLLQRLGFDLPVHLTDRVIVHTEAGRETLIRRGLSGGRLAVIPHGPLSLGIELPPSRCGERRRTFTLFGEMKPYKGLDLVVEAVALLPAAVRERTRFVVAGRPRMDLAPLLARIERLGLENVIEVRPRRLTHEEMAQLFADTDCFLFPYRQIDASGVYFLVQSLKRWIIASNVGIFAEDLADGERGTLIPAEDAEALARAIADNLTTTPTPLPVASGSTWTTIGRATRAVYRTACAEAAA